MTMATLTNEPYTDMYNVTKPWKDWAIIRSSGWCQRACWHLIVSSPEFVPFLFCLFYLCLFTCFLHSFLFCCSFSPLPVTVHECFPLVQWLHLQPHSQGQYISAWFYSPHWFSASRKKGKAKLTAVWYLYPPKKIALCLYHCLYLLNIHPGMERPIQHYQCGTRKKPYIKKFIRLVLVLRPHTITSSMFKTSHICCLCVYCKCNTLGLQNPSDTVKRCCGVTVESLEGCKITHASDEEAHWKAAIMD